MQIIFLCYVRVVQLWREELAKTNKKAAESLADPTEYENLFPDLKEAVLAEKMLKRERTGLLPAKQYPLVQNSLSRDVLAELREALENGTLDVVTICVLIYYMP